MSVTSVELINNVVANCSLEYQNHVGKVTRATIDTFIKNTDSYRISWNEFIPNLINNCAKTLIHETAINGIYERFTDSQMYTEGDWVQELGMYLPQANDYELQGGNPFMYAPPKVASQYHGMNRAQYYPLTINEMELKRALLGSDYAASNMVADLSASCGMAALADSTAIYEQLVIDACNDTDIYNCNVPNFLSSATEDNAIAVLVAIRSQMDRAMIPQESTKYNPFHLPRTPEDFVIFATPEFKANILVTAAWRSMNLVEATRLPEIIPVRGLPTGVQCLLIETKFLRGMKTYEGMTSQFNAVNLYTNFFYHVQGIYFYSKMRFACKFSTAATTSQWDTVPASTAACAKIGGTSNMGVSVAWDSTNDRYKITLKAGSEIQFSGQTAASSVSHAEPVASTSGQDQCLIYKIYDEDGAVLDTNTYCSPAGKVHISSEEPAGTVFTIGVYQYKNSTKLQDIVVTTAAYSANDDDDNDDEEVVEKIPDVVEEE